MCARAFVRASDIGSRSPTNATHKATKPKARPEKAKPQTKESRGDSARCIAGTCWLLESNASPFTATLLTVFCLSSIKSESSGVDGYRVAWDLYGVCGRGAEPLSGKRGEKLKRTQTTKRESECLICSSRSPTPNLSGFKNLALALANVKKREREIFIYFSYFEKKKRDLHRSLKQHH